MTEHPTSSNPSPASPVDQVRESGAFRTPTVAEIHVDRLLRNADVLQGVCGDAELMAVVKAGAYGHGASRVARELADHGIGLFAVATAAEGINLRRSDVDGRILVLTAPLPEHVSAYSTYDLELTISSAAVANQIIALAADGDRFRVHVKIDTGMGRIGVRPEDAVAVVRKLERASNVELAGIWTHLATADEPDLDYTHRQLDRFDKIVAEIGDTAEYIHVANSAAALRLPRATSYDRTLARVGIGLYGYSSMEGLAEEHGLRPVMKVTSRVTQVKTVAPGTTVSYGRTWTAERTTRIATVGAGYADGYHRRLSNRSRVGIGGEHYPVAGTVCMDAFMVDVGPESDVEEGDEVVLFGEGGPDAFAVASWAETIPYEILTSVSARVPRIYVD